MKKNSSAYVFFSFKASLSNKRAAARKCLFEKFNIVWKCCLVTWELLGYLKVKKKLFAP